MLARTADSLFWMSRYIERFDFITKILMVGYSSTIDYQDNSRNNFSWETTSKIFYSHPEQFNPDGEPADQVLRTLVISDEYNSLKDLITKARENARGVQEHISKEVWESINKKYHKLLKVDIEKVIKKNDQLNFLVNLFDENLKYAGVLESTNHRGEGWNFINLGKYIERSILTVNLSEAKFQNSNVFTENANNILFWKNFLLSLSGFELYIKDYRGNDNSRQVLDMIVFNTEFTRSISFTTNRLRNYIQNIMTENPNPNNDKLRKEIGMLSAKINYSEIDNIIEEGVPTFLHYIRSKYYALSNSIGQTFFSYY